MCLISGGAWISIVAGLVGMPGRTNCNSPNATSPATRVLASIFIDRRLRLLKTSYLSGIDHNSSSRGSGPSQLSKLEFYDNFGQSSRGDEIMCKLNIPNVQAL